MRDFTPKRPTGTDDEARFMQWVYDMLLAGRINDSPGVKVIRTSKGTTLIINPPPPAEAGSDDGVWL